MKLSVIMPILKVDKFLEETFVSLENQTYKDFKLIIVCQNTEYESLIFFIKKQKISFKYEVIQTNLKGVAFASNLAINQIDTLYVARWDSDDLSDPRKFELQINELETNKSLGVVGTIVELIDEKGNKINFQKFKFFENNIEIRRALKYRQPLLHSSLMFRSQILFDNKGYLYGHTSEDHEMFIRIARDQNVKFKNLKSVTTYYRRHKAQLSDMKNYKKHFYEISGFLFSEFLRSLNPLYIIGIFANLPIFRKIRYMFRKLLKFLSK